MTDEVAGSVAPRYLPPRLSKDRDEIILKFDELIVLAGKLGTVTYYGPMSRRGMTGWPVWSRR